MNSASYLPIAVSIIFSLLVAWRLARPGEAAGVGLFGTEDSGKEEERRRLYDSLEALEYDFRGGKLSAEEYSVEHEVLIQQVASVEEDAAS